MSVRRVIVASLLGAVLLAPVALGAWRLADAHRAVEAAESVLDIAAQDAREILDRRARKQVVAAAERPTQDVIARINTTLREASLSTQAFQSLTPQSSAAVPGAQSGDGPRYGRQSLRLNLRGLTPGELGRFISLWSRTQELWHVERVELSHARAGRGNDDDNRYDAMLQLSTLYVAED